MDLPELIPLEIYSDKESLVDCINTLVTLVKEHQTSIDRLERELEDVRKQISRVNQRPSKPEIINS